MLARFVAVDPEPCRFPHKTLKELSLGFVGMLHVIGGGQIKEISAFEPPEGHPASRT